MEHLQCNRFTITALGCYDPLNVYVPYVLTGDANDSIKRRPSVRIGGRRGKNLTIVQQGVKKCLKIVQQIVFQRFTVLKGRLDR